uniref:Endonuclease/exonuclease/phosphatase family protein n=1 Tax=Pithovirus LCDPAC01 TaxID=2506600 RepID=A0A481YN93_9VIRU|nr:MAG: hypothetical protein LCDPAC01_00580 [Pithovirus LCDPAC01]
MNANIYVFTEARSSFLNRKMLEYGYKGKCYSKKCALDGTCIYWNSRLRYVSSGCGRFLMLNGKNASQGYLYVVLQHSMGTTIGVIGTHLKSLKTLKGEIRSYQASQLRAMYNVLERKTKLVIMAGDFNTKPDEYPGLAFRSFEGLNVHITHRKKRNGILLSRVVDNIISNREALVAGVYGDNGQLIPNCDTDGSDHFPITAVFQLYDMYLYALIIAATLMWWTVDTFVV